VSAADKKITGGAAGQGGAGNGGVREPDGFEFTPENTAEISRILERYPTDHCESAVMPILDLAQRQMGGWLPQAAMDRVAGILGMAPIRVYEVATFYSMFNLEPVGRHHVQVCTTTPCWLRGSDDITATCKRLLGVSFGETTPDGEFTLGEVECLGACVNAPMVKINDDYYEDLEPASVEAVINQIKRGEKPRSGSQTSRKGASPANGLTSLTSEHFKPTVLPALNLLKRKSKKS